MATKNLIVYYSWVGNTEAAAKEIQNLTGFDLQKIEEKKQRKPGMMGAAMGAVFGLKSALKPMDYSLEGYENILLGLQVWASKTTPAMNRYLSKASFKDKKVWLFVTLGDDKPPQKMIDSVTKRIEKKGGKVAGSTWITTQWDPKTNIVTSQEVIKEKMMQWLKDIKESL